MLCHPVDSSNMLWFAILSVVAVAYALAHLCLGRSHLLPTLFFFLGVLATAFAMAPLLAGEEALTLGMCVVGAAFVASSAYLHVHRSPK